MDPTQPIDLRSDTVTKPTPAMRKAIAEAEVGDDVLGDDPTVNCLQEEVANLLGKEAAIFVPSGTMANQIAVRTLCEPGDEIIMHQASHVYLYEGGAPAALSGCLTRLLPGDRGQFTAEQLRQAVRPANPHFARSRLVVLENTHNRGGGSIWPLEPIEAIHAQARELKLALHLDGARLLNACVATGISASAYARYFDTVSICFSKGLGAPVGSAMAGSRELVERAHRFRKMFGGGMRQAGLLAAAALYALKHNVERLAEDHENARALAAGVAEISGVGVDVGSVETNMVYLDVDPALGTAQGLVDALHEAGVWTLAESAQRIRAVTHLEVTREDVDRAIGIIEKVVAGRQSQSG